MQLSRNLENQLCMWQSFTSGCCFFLICAKTAAGDAVPADVLTKNVFLLYYFYLLIEIYLIFL